MYLSETGPVGVEGQKEKWLVNFSGYKRILNLFPFPNPYPDPPLYPDDVPVGQGRGIFNSVRGNIAIIVVNSTVFSMSPTLNLTNLGTINTSVGEVVIAENLNSQIAIVDGKDAWIYNYSLPAPNLVRQTDGALGTGALLPNYVEYHNTFFLFGNANQTAGNGSAWYVYSFSTATGATAIVQTQQLALQTKADFASAVKRLPGRGNNVIVFGTTVCEIWTQVGGTQIYQRNQSININYGCQSVSTIAEGADILVWLGVNEDETPVIMYYGGDGVTVISTDGIEYLLGSLKAPATSTASLFREDGHLFYLVTFFDPRDNLTLMYDFDTKLFFNLTNQDLDFHPARALIYFNLKTYFVSLRNAALYELSSDITVIDENLPQTSASDPYDTNLVYTMQRMRITSNVRQVTSARFIANSLVITLEQGCDEAYPGGDTEDDLITESTNNPADDIIITEFGDTMIDEDSGTSGSGNVDYQPRIDLRFSKDGGISWSNYVSRVLHPLGHRQNILHWEGMGVANDICFCFRFWQINRLVANQALLDLIP